MYFSLSCMVLMSNDCIQFLILKTRKNEKISLIFQDSKETLKSVLYTHTRPISDGAVLRLKLVDGRCRVQFPVALVDLAARSFPWFSPKLT